MISSSISVCSSGRERRSPLRISFYVGSSHCTKSAKWARGESIPRTRITLALLSRLFSWRDALIVVQPKTLIRWHRAGFRFLWHWKSKPGRPPIPAELRRLIREMSRDNSLWGEERIWPFAKPFEDVEHLLQPRTAPYGVRARRTRSTKGCAGAVAASSATPEREPSGRGQACIERAAP